MHAFGNLVLALYCHRMCPALTLQLLANLNPQYEVMVTAGANQAFVNLVLALCDASDRVALFAPYYFNHLMALQMTGGGDRCGLKSKSARASLRMVCCCQDTPHTHNTHNSGRCLVHVTPPQ